MKENIAKIQITYKNITEGEIDAIGDHLKCDECYAHIVECYKNTLYIVYSEKGYYMLLCKDCFDCWDSERGKIKQCASCKNKDRFIQTFKISNNNHICNQCLKEMLRNYPPPKYDEKAKTFINRRPHICPNIEEGWQAIMETWGECPKCKAEICQSCGKATKEYMQLKKQNEQISICPECWQQQEKQWREEARKHGIKIYQIKPLVTEKI